MRETRTKTTARKTAKKTNKNASRAKNKKPNNGLLTQDRRQNRLSMFMAVLVVVIILIAVAVNSVSLTRRLKSARRILRSTADIPVRTPILKRSPAKSSD